MSEAYADSLEQQDVGDVTFLRIQIPMLYADQTTEDLFLRLEALVVDSGHRKFVLDLGVIEYLASAALGKLVSLHRKARAAGARLVLCNVPPNLARMLQITRLADVMIVCRSEREALGSFA